MIWIDDMKAAIRYIESHLEEAVDYEKAADLMGYSVYHFQRLFMLIAGVSLAEYIRNRRLTKAAVDLQDGEQKVIDVALKYGYKSPTSFNRAFQAVHGMAPSEAKKTGVTIKAFPPLSFDLTIKSSGMLDYRIEEKAAFRMVGTSIQTTTENGESYQRIPALWGDLQKNGKIMEFLALMNQQPYGLLGISDYNPDLSTSTFDYYIGTSSDSPLIEGMTELVIPSGTWAIFTCQSPQEVGPLQQRVITEWLPSFGYEFAKLPDVELYNADNSAEIWLPIRRIN